MTIYRVVSTEEPVVHYHGWSFEHASLVFDQAKGSRVMERFIAGEWSSVMSYHKGG